MAIIYISDLPKMPIPNATNYVAHVQEVTKDGKHQYDKNLNVQDMIDHITQVVIKYLEEKEQIERTSELEMKDEIYNLLKNM